MARTLYAACIVSLLAGTAWTAAGAQLRSPAPQPGLGLLILVALQR
jgi:hypothetical protein